jgi:hypothetical protein
MTRIDAIGVMNAIDNMDIKKKPVMMIMSTESTGSIGSQVMDAGASYFFPMQANI